MQNSSACSSGKESEKIQPVWKTEAQRWKTNQGKRNLNPGSGLLASVCRDFVPAAPLLGPLPPEESWAESWGSRSPGQSCDCLMLAPVIVSVADPLTHLIKRSKAFIPQSRRVNGDNPGVIASKTSEGKIHHVLSPAILWVQRLVGASSWHRDAVVQENRLSPSNQEGDVLHIPGCSADVCAVWVKRATGLQGAKPRVPRWEGEAAWSPAPKQGKLPVSTLLTRLGPWQSVWKRQICLGSFVYCYSFPKSCPTLCDSLNMHTRLLCPAPSPSSLRFMPIESLMLSKHLILCWHDLLLPSVFPNTRVFSDELALCIRWPKYWSFSFSISPPNEYSGLISFRIDQFNPLAVQGTLKSLLQHHRSKASVV